MNDQRNVHRLLVTGGAGFIGSAFIRYLLSPKSGFQGVCVNLDALTYAGRLENLRDVENDPRYFFYHGNICNSELVNQLCTKHAIDTIVHFAAESHVDRSIASPALFIETNIVGTFSLLEAVRRHPHIHFHHISTDEVFGMLGSEGCFTEESSYHPNSPYSASKAASDHLVRAYAHTYNLSTTLSNCSNNYGPYQDREKLIPLIIHNCLERKSLPIYGRGDQVRDWLHVDDHVHALYLIIRKGKKGETYAIGGESERRNIDLVHTLINSVAEVQGIEKRELEQLITFVPDRPGHDARYAIDCSKIKRELGWKPTLSLDAGIKQTVGWYMAPIGTNH